MNYLEEYRHKIVVLRSENEKFPLWRQNRDFYLYDGVINDENLREILPDEMIIEFDKKGTHPLGILKSEARRYIKRIEDIFYKQKKGFHTTDHGGISPHLRTRIIGLEQEDWEIRKKYKKEFIENLLQQIGFKEKYVQLDVSLIGSKNKIVPIEGQPHWKNKYNGALEKVISYNPQPYTQVVQDKIRFLKTNVTTPSLSPAQLSYSCKNINIRNLQKIFDFMYKEGKREATIHIFSGMFKYKGVSYEEGKRILINLLNNTPTPKQHNNQDLRAYKRGYYKDNNAYGLMKYYFPKTYLFQPLSRCFEVDI